MDIEKNMAKNPEQFKHLSNVDYIEQGGYPLVVKKIIHSIVLFIVFFLVWASLTTIHEVAISYGSITPKTDVFAVQHVQGGTIKKILVKNGQEVVEGQSLVMLDPDMARETLEKAQSKELTLMLNAARLEAFIDKKSAQSIDWNAIVKNLAYNTSDHHALIQKSIKEDVRYLNQQNAERDKQTDIFKEKIIQKKAELKQYHDSQLELAKKLELYEKEQKMYESVVDKGYVSRREYLESQRKTIEARSQLKQVKAKIDASKSAIQEAQQELAKAEAVFNKQALEKLDDIDGELLAVRHTILNDTELKKKLLIKAPIAGIVKGLTLSVGSVVPPAASVMEIVPTHSPMIVECKISTKDIGNVKVGDPAKVRVAAYDYTRYGDVNGRLISISPSTFTTEKGLPYYKGKVTLEKSYVGDNPKANVLVPGMTVEVNIITGKKSIMAYLMKPITRGLNSSFRER